jgi:hypothetical protein
LPTCSKLQSAPPSLGETSRGALVSEEGRERALGIRTGTREFVGPAHSRRLDIRQHDAIKQPVQVAGGDLEGLAGGSASFHGGWI